MLHTFVTGLKMFDCALLTPAITSATVGNFGSADIVLLFSSENISLLQHIFA